MTTPRKTRIEAAMVTRFQITAGTVYNATTGAAYRTTISNVFNDPSMPTTFEEVGTDLRPCVIIKTKQQEKLPFPGHYRTTQAYDLYAFVSAADRDSTNAALDNLEADLRAAIDSDPTWGASADYSGQRNAMLTNFLPLHTEDIPDRSQGVLILPIAVTYIEGRSD